MPYQLFTGYIRQGKSNQVLNSALHTCLRFAQRKYKEARAYMVTTDG